MMYVCGEKINSRTPGVEGTSRVNLALKPRKSSTINGHQCGELSLNWTLLSISGDSDIYTHISSSFFFNI